MRFIITDRNEIVNSVYSASDVSVHQACCERATQPYSLGGRGTICPGSRSLGVTTRRPRMVTECLLTRSILIKMYYLFMVCARICTLVFTAGQFHAAVYMYLVMYLHVFHGLESRFVQSLII